MTYEETQSLVTDLRERVEERLQLDLSPRAAIRLENRIFEALAFGENNVFVTAERAERVKHGFSVWKG